MAQVRPQAPARRRPPPSPSRIRVGKNPSYLSLKAPLPQRFLSTPFLWHYDDGRAFGASLRPLDSIGTFRRNLSTTVTLQDRGGSEFHTTECVLQRIVHNLLESSRALSSSPAPCCSPLIMRRVGAQRHPRIRESPGR